MVACWVGVVSTNEYLTIWVNTRRTHLLNGLRFFNLGTTCLLNGLVISTHLSDFIKAKKKKKKKSSINQIDPDYEKLKKYFFNINFRTNKSMHHK